MNALSSRVRFIIICAGVLMSTTRDAAAYLDPGSGSYFFQILIAGLTAAVFFFSSLKRKAVQLCRLVKGSKIDTDTHPGPASQRDS